MNSNIGRLTIVSPATLEALSIHLLAALEVLASTVPSPSAQDIKLLLCPAMHACLACMRKSFLLADGASPISAHAEAPPPQEHLRVSSRPPLPHLQPLTDAAAALLSSLLRSASKALSPALYSEVQTSLTAESPSSHHAGLVALLVSLEARQKPSVPPRTIPDVLTTLLQLLADSPLLSPMTPITHGPKAARLRMSGNAADLIETRAASSDACMPRREWVHGNRLSGSCALAVLTLRCIESVTAQAAAFRNIGPAGHAVVPSMASFAVALVALASSVAQQDDGQALREGVLLALMGACAVVTGVLRHREALVQPAWPVLPSFCSSVLHALTALYPSSSPGYGLSCVCRWNVLLMQNVLRTSVFRKSFAVHAAQRHDGASCFALTPH
jgi:hypothetical protein